MGQRREFVGLLPLLFWATAVQNSMCLYSDAISRPKKMIENKSDCSDMKTHGRRSRWMQRGILASMCVLANPAWS